MKQNASSRKVNEQARETIASVLLFEMSDPRLEGITVLSCEVSFDRSVCNVFYTTAPENYDAAAAALEAGKGRVRSLIASQLNWRVAPELRFLLDETVDSAERIEAAIAREQERLSETETISEDEDEAETEQQSGFVTEPDEREETDAE